MYKKKTLKTRFRGPILHYDPRSPPGRAVLLVAAEIGVELDLRPEHPSLSNPTKEKPKLNDNGVVIHDFYEICIHLAEKYSTNDNLFPKEPAARDQVMVGLNLDFLQMCVYDIIDQKLQQYSVEYILDSSYDMMESLMSRKEDDEPYMCGKYMTIADLCCIAAISTGHELVPIDKVKFPTLFRWVERMSALPYYEKCNGEGAKMLKSVLLQKLEENKKK